MLAGSLSDSYYYYYYYYYYCYCYFYYYYYYSTMMTITPLTHSKWVLQEVLGGKTIIVFRCIMAGNEDLGNRKRNQ